ncbi:MAG: hypothetical protein QXV24_04450 [Nitrososphaerota archaeon]
MKRQQLAMTDMMLRCICGQVLTPDVMIIKVGSGSAEIHCPNPRCRLGIIGTYTESKIRKKLRLVKMVEEYNMLFMGSEDLQDTLRHWERAIADKISRNNS